MLRYRRYRVFVVFAVIALFALYKFSSSGPSWRVDETETAEEGGKKENVVQSLHWQLHPQVAQETKKFQVEIPAATSVDRNTPPAIAPVSRPVERPPPEPLSPPSPASTNPPVKPTPIDQDAGDDTSPSPSPEGELVEGADGRVEVTPSPTSIEAVHWKKESEHFPVPSKSIIKLPSSTSKPIPKIQYNFKPESASAKAEREAKLNTIRGVFKHSWEGYRKHAWLQDELSPVSGNFRNPFASWGATLVDALDTLWIMDLKEEFDEAVKAVDEIDFTTSPRADIPLFETTIRYLGGLLAAYDISGKKHKNLLDKAVELAEVLISAFDTPNRMPHTYYYWRPSFSSQPHRASNRVVMAEIGSLSVEFTRLAQLTGEHKYYDAIARITDALEDFQNKTRLPGMWPTYLDASGCQKVDWASEVEATPLQAPLDALKDSSEESLKDDPVQNEKKEPIPTIGSTEEKKMVPLDLPSPIVLKATDPKTTDGPSDETKVSQNVKRQLEDAELSNEKVAAISAAAEAASSTSSTALEPECTGQGLGPASNYGGEDYTLGGMSDSTYEYLPKEYLLLGGQVEKYRTMYETSMDVVKENLIFRPMLPRNEDILFSGALSVPAAKPKKGKGVFEGENAHLTCFAGGMFGMGAKIFDRPEDLEIAKKLTDGCIWSYNMTSTGIMPESFIAVPCESIKGCEWNKTKYWEVIDPGAENRVTSYKQQMITYEQQMASASEWYQEQLAAMTAVPSSTSSFEAETTPTERVFADTLDKRQLDVETVPAPNVPPRYAQDSEEELSVKSPTRVQDEPIQLPSPALPVFPIIYSPKPPLTHEEYVKNRIQEERLPPGVTHIKARNYILRPEAIESVWYMYRITGDPYWREAGWQMFEAINTHTRAEFGNSAIDDVTRSAPDLLDEMESFWLAETLKYFYLLFAEESLVSLDDWVLNTEAHPFRRPK
ncbi:seven-hairpin glycosidase [Lojkania enalia]|uniref:alpha-1,2-Mannosidase n=1 Tax=Lojkania enalia TaxID=147567 RepID=A0A9P4N002_9PLEO|nr:seven-hairpin glycosidase [Didymosphaeria enalia]